MNTLTYQVKLVYWDGEELVVTNQYDDPTKYTSLEEATLAALDGAASYTKLGMLVCADDEEIAVLSNEGALVRSFKPMFNVSPLSRLNYTVSALEYRQAVDALCELKETA